MRPSPVVSIVCHILAQSVCKTVTHPITKQVSCLFFPSGASSHRSQSSSYEDTVAQRITQSYITTVAPEGKNKQEFLFIFSLGGYRLDITLCNSLRHRVFVARTL